MTIWEASTVSVTWTFANWTAASSFNTPIYMGSTFAHDYFRWDEASHFCRTCGGFTHIGQAPLIWRVG
jgi:hypothetical protein